MEIKSLEEIYHLTSTLFGKRKELSPILQESNQDSFIKKITPYVKSECIDCTDLIAHDEQESEIGDRVKKLYDFLNEFNDIFGESSTHKLLKKVGFIESHIKATIDSLKSVTHFRSHLNLEELSQWDNKNFIQSVGAHKEVSEKQTELADDFFKPLVSYFLNDLTKDKKAELMIKNLTAQLAKTPTLEGLAGSLGDSLKVATGVNFAAYQFGLAGMEPAVIGKSTVIALNKVSAVENWDFGRKIVFCKGNVMEKEGIEYYPWYLSMFYQPEKEPERFIYEVDLVGL